MDLKIDDLDSQIILALNENARKPLTEIGKELLVSTATVHQRVKKLERAGIISGYSLSIDYKKFGYLLTVYVGIHVAAGHSALEVLDQLDGIPEVTVADLAAGTYSIFCKLRCRDTIHAKDTIFAIEDLSGVNATETMIMLEEHLNDNRRLLRKIIETKKEQFR